MNNSTNGTTGVNWGLITPPSSPRKRSSLGYPFELDNGIPTPPASPRKSKSCILPRLSHPLFLTPPTSPIKSDGDLWTEPLPTLSIEKPPLIGRTLSVDGSDDRNTLTGTGEKDCSLSENTNLLAIDNLEDVQGLETNAPSPENRPKSPEHNRRRINFTKPDGTALPQVFGADDETATPLTQAPFARSFPFPHEERNALSPLPLRQFSSPLRPSQWVARGGTLSPPRTPSRRPDRFIPSRRPPNSTRESFHLTKSTDRLTAGERLTRQGILSPDPFSRQLRRSGRLNEELRTLRETHSIITGRAVLGRNGAALGLRRGSLTSNTRQISNGAVWNVGGSSVVSDTVVGVSNGRGGLLGSGTNAPLYTSMFLSRSDPEAELETHERRLALAFDVDQSSRVLGDTSPPNSPTSPGGTSSGYGSNSNFPTKHVWADSAWVKEGSTTRLSSIIIWSTLFHR